MPLAQKVQVFGGPWSLIKTDMVQQYLHFFNTALKSKPFERVYIDAFAGSGAFRYVPDGPTNSLFPVEPSSHIHIGSAQRALSVQPPFDRIIFIEEDSSNAKALDRLIELSRHPRAEVRCGDANDLLRSICRPQLWRKRRGVIFLDPFGMHVEWATLGMIAATKALDVWFLFSLAGTVRNLPRLASRLDDGKKAAVTRVLGTDEWYEKFYSAPGFRYRGLLDGSLSSPVVRRHASVTDIEKFVYDRLKLIFPHVEPPRRLYGPRNTSLFSLFFAVSNPNKMAINLASRAAAHILRGKSDIHPTSGRRARVRRASYSYRPIV